MTGAAAPRVLLHTDAPREMRRRLAAAHPDLEIGTCDSYAALPDTLARVAPEVVFTNRFAGTAGYPRQALLEAPSVRWISIAGSGTDHLLPWDPAHVTVTNSAGVAAEMMAQYAVGAMLSFTLGFPAFARDQRARRWSDGKVIPITGKTVLVLGLGKTGRAVADWSQRIGLTVLGVRANPRATAHVDEVHGVGDLPALWPRADFIVCCLPLLDTTRGLVDGTAFDAMKCGAVLVDLSRGGIVVERALLGALKSGVLAGAALDVFEVEPLPPDNPLWARDDVIITPHCSSVYDGWQEKALAMFAENLGRYRRGEPLSNIVDPARGY